VKKQLVFLSLLLISGFFSAGQNSFSISGFIRDSVTAEPLASANVLVKNTPEGTTSDTEGRFDLFFSGDKKTAILLVRFLGYREKEITVSEGQSLVIILLAREPVNKQEIEITDSRIPKNILESPFTQLHIDAKTIEQLPQENYYAGLASFKGMDISTGSLFYQNVNMRGPANPLNETILQLIDGIDNMPPGQGSSTGNLAGIPDLDIESIQVIPGSASALYGANAFSGLINIHSKSPFIHRGLSVQFKNGLNFIDGKEHDPALFTDYQIRYARVWKEKFAWKINIAYAQGMDWLLLDQTDWDISIPEEERGANNPGRDLFNIYGDEISEVLLLDSNYTRVSRTGYDGNTVMGTRTWDLKLNTSLHYKLNKKRNCPICSAIHFSPQMSTLPPGSIKTSVS
jgi:hypothetical protein